MFQIRNTCQCLVRTPRWSSYPRHIHHLHSKAYLPILIQVYSNILLKKIKGTWHNTDSLVSNQWPATDLTINSVIVFEHVERVKVMMAMALIHLCFGGDSPLGYVKIHFANFFSATTAISSSCIMI